MDHISGKIKWEEQGKIRVRESTEAQVKHLLVKALIVFYIKLKHKKDSNYIKIYTEWQIKSGKICDVYYENILNKEAIAYEVQDKITTKWMEETKQAYKGWEVHGIKDTDYVIVDLNKTSDNIEEMKQQIKELVI